MEYETIAQRAQDNCYEKLKSKVRISGNCSRRNLSVGALLFHRPSVPEPGLIGNMASMFKGYMYILLSGNRYLKAGIRGWPAQLRDVLDRANQRLLSVKAFQVLIVHIPTTQPGPESSKSARTYLKVITLNYIGRNYRQTKDNNGTYYDFSDTRFEASCCIGLSLCGFWQLVMRHAHSFVQVRTPYKDTL